MRCVQPQIIARFIGDVRLMCLSLCQIRVRDLKSCARPTATTETGSAATERMKECGGGRKSESTETSFTFYSAFFCYLFRY